MSATAEPLPGNLTGGADGCVGCVPGHTYILPGSNSTCPQGNCAYIYNPGSPGSSNYCGSSGACWTPTTVANTTPNTPAAPGVSLPAPGTTNAWVVGRSVEHGQDITLSDPISPPLGTPPSAWPKPPTAVVQTPPAPQTQGQLTSPFNTGSGSITPPPASSGSANSGNSGSNNQTTVIPTSATGTNGGCIPNPCVSPISSSTNQDDFPKATVIGANPGAPQTSYVLAIHDGSTLQNPDGSSDLYTKQGNQWYQTHYQPDATSGTKQPVGFGATTDPSHPNSSGFYVYPILPNNTAGVPTMLTNNGMPQPGATPYRANK